MKYNLKINGYEVLMMASRGNDKLVMLRKEWPDSPHVEFIVTVTTDGQSYFDSSYFHSADYGGEDNAQSAANLKFLYRAGFTSFFDRISRITAPWAWKGMSDLHIAHKPRDDAREPMYKAVRQVIEQMKVGEWMPLEKLNEKRMAIQGIEHFGSTNGLHAVKFYIENHLQGWVKIDKPTKTEGMTATEEHTIGVTRL